MYQFSIYINFLCECIYITKPRRIFSIWCEEKKSDSSEVRTRDPHIKSVMLYQLS